MRDYKITDRVVFFREKEIPGADPEAFRVLGAGLGADERRVYYKGRETDLDPATVLLCGGHYVKDRCRVRRILKTKLVPLKADAPGFSAWNEAFAGDGASVFFRGKRLAAADRASFRVLQGDLAWDHSYLYCGGGRIAHELPAGEAPRLLPSQEDPERLLVILGEAAVYLEGQALLFTTLLRGIDPETLRFVHGGFLQDKHAFYYRHTRLCPNRGERAAGLPGWDRLLFLDRRVFLRGEELKGAHRESLRALGPLLYDKDRIYYGDFFDDRISGDASTLRRRPLSGEVTQETVRRDLDALFGALFFLLDRYLPADLLGKEDGRADLPAYDLSFEGPALRLAWGEKRVTGRFSAFLLLGGEFWALSRGVSAGEGPLVRLLFGGLNYDDGYELVRRLQKGAPAECLRIALFFRQRGEPDEADLIVHKLLEDPAASGRPGEAPLPMALCPEELLERARPVPKLPRSSESFSGLLQELLSAWEEADPVERLAWARRLYTLIVDASEKPAAQGPLTEPLPGLIREESCPAVREILFLAAELALQKLHPAVPSKDKAPYGRLYPLLRCQLDRGINADLNSARLWETARILGLSSEEAPAEEGLDRLIASGLRAPGTAWLFPSYPDYRLWKLDARLRIAAVLPIGAAAEELAALFDELDALRGSYSARFGEAFRLLQENMAALCRLRSLPLPFEDPAGEGSLSTVSNLVLARTSSPYVLSGIRLVERGMFRFREDPLRPGLSPELLRPGKELTLKRGDCFGLEFVPDGQPWGRELPVRIEVSHPGEIGGSRISRIDGTAAVGMKNAFFWRMGREEELLPGRWKMEIRFPETPRDEALRVSFRIACEAPSGERRRP